MESYLKKVHTAHSPAVRSKGLRMENLFSIEESAKKLGGLSIHTINTWLSQGRLRRTKVGARTMIRESELERIVIDGGKSTGRQRIVHRASRNGGAK